MTYKDPSSRRKVKAGIGLCKLLSLLPALPMVLPSTDTRTAAKDGSGCTCDFPYESIWSSMDDLYLISTVYVLGCMGLGFILAVLHHPDLLHPDYLAADCNRFEEPRNGRVGFIKLTFILVSKQSQYSTV